jgi:hypothetical protein
MPQLRRRISPRIAAKITLIIEELRKETPLRNRIAK